MFLPSKDPTAEIIISVLFSGHFKADADFSKCVVCQNSCQIFTALLIFSIRSFGNWERFSCHEVDSSQLTAIYIKCIITLFLVL